MMQHETCTLGKYNIGPIAILRGMARTTLSEKDLKNLDEAKYFEWRILLGCVADPKDMTGLAAFLACEMSSYEVRCISICCYYRKLRSVKKLED
jgi:hypothetical protein